MSKYDELVERICEDPDEGTSWEVLQDWLLDLDDPRGRLADAYKRDLREGDALLEQLAPEWFGSGMSWKINRGEVTLQGPDQTEETNPIVRLSFVRGHARFLEINDRWSQSWNFGWEDGDWGQSWILPMLDRLLSQPVGQLLTDVRVGLIQNPTLRYEGLIETIAAARPRALRLLSCSGGNPEIQEDASDRKMSYVPDCSALWEAAPRLDWVHLNGMGIRTGVIRHGTLRKLSIESVNLTAEPVCALGLAELPELQELELCFGSTEGGCALQDLLPVFRRPFPSLGSLRLLGWALDEEQLVSSLLDASWISGLGELSLKGSVLSDRGGEMLLARASSLELYELDVSGCYLSDDMVRRLGDVFEVKAERQREPWKGRRTAQVGEFDDYE